MKILLNGGCGRMGKAIRSLVAKEYPDMVLFPVDIKREEGVYDINDVIDFDCVIDFSSKEGFISALNHSLKYRKPFLSGTTTIGEEEKKLLVEASNNIAVFHSPNMSIGVNICFILVDFISKNIVADVYINELHHKAKKDKPSGTALRLKEIIEKNGLKVDISGLRVGDVIGEHEIGFIMKGERIVISHIAQDRELFARGSIEVARWLINKEKGLYSFYDFLSIEKRIL